MAPTASIEAVSRGNALIRTEAIAAANTANRCQAGAVSPGGTGKNQMRGANAKGTARLIRIAAVIEVTLPLRDRAAHDPAGRRRPLEPRPPRPPSPIAT